MTGPRVPWTLTLRTAALVVALASWRAGGWALLPGAWALLTLLRAPSRRLLLEVVAAAGVVAALGQGPVPAACGLVIAGLALALVTIREAPWPLNGLDRYFVCQEYPGAAANTHHVVDSARPFDPQGLARALRLVVEETPVARTFVREAWLGVERSVAPAWFDPAARIHRLEVPLELRPDLLDRPFDLAREPPWRVVVAPRAEGGWRLVLTAHHSAVDGAGGVRLLERLLRRYDEARRGVPPARVDEDPPATRFRDVLRPRGLAWLARMVARHVKPLDKVGVKNASLLDDEARGWTGSRHLLTAIDPARWAALKERAAALGVTRNDLLVTATLRAADGWRRARGKEDRPFRLLLPTDLRATLGLPPSMQNVVGVVKADFAAAEVRAPELPGVVSGRIKLGRTVDEAVETPVNLGVVSAVLPPFAFRAALRRFDHDPRSFFFSLLVSTIRLPADLPAPADLGVERVWIRGSLARSPGVGLVLTDDGRQVTVAFEYLVPIASEAGVADLRQRFETEVAKFVELR